MCELVGLELKMYAIKIFYSNRDCGALKNQFEQCDSYSDCDIENRLTWVLPKKTFQDYLQRWFKCQWEFNIKLKKRS